MKFFTGFSTISRYYLMSFSLTFLFLFAFYKQTSGVDNILSLVYVLGIPGYYYIIFFLLSLLLYPLGRIPYFKYIVIVPKIIFDIFLLMDIFVFRIYRFHIDTMFINMFIHDFKGIGLSFSMLISAIIAGLLIVLLNLWFYKQAVRKSFKTLGWQLVILLLFLINQSLHIWAYDYNQKNITKYTPYFPYYLPTISHPIMVSFHKLLPKYFTKPGYNKEKQLEELLSNKNNIGDIFNYPLHPLHINDDSITKRPNILIFTTESWRSDMMTQEVTPHIYEFSRKAYNYKDHKSTGNVTVSGLFGLFYGLHPSYLQYAQANPYKYQTVFTKSLQKAGYSISVYTPSNLDRFVLKKLFFGPIPDSNYHNQRSLPTIENDRYAIDKLKEDITNDTLARPWFKFVFLDSSHHNYKYPKEDEVFLPVPDNSEAFVFNKNIDATPFVNDYKNSLHYVDALFQEVFLLLKDKNLLDNTLIIISSDHAEEFNENKAGYWGHGSNFTRYQTTVPFILKLPHSEEFKQIFTPSGHIDIVPTLLSTMVGVTNPLSDYSSGKNLFNLPKHRGFSIASYVDKAYLIDGNIYANGLSFKSYNENDINKENDSIDYQLINILRKEDRHFLK